MEDPPVELWARLAAYAEAARIASGNESASEIVRRLSRMTPVQCSMIEQALRELLDDQDSSEASP
jgi:hypothetical protein